MNEAGWIGLGELVPSERPRETAFRGHTMHDMCCNDPDICICDCRYCDCRYAEEPE